MNYDEGIYNFVNSSDMETAVSEKAREAFPDAWDLAVETQDEDLFKKVWDKALTLVLDDVFTSLIQKGLLEVAGMSEDGEMSYSLTKDGERIAKNYE